MIDNENDGVLLCDSRSPHGIIKLSYIFKKWQMLSSYIFHQHFILWFLLNTHKYEGKYIFTYFHSSICHQWNKLCYWNHRILTLFLNKFLLRLIYQVKIIMPATINKIVLCLISFWLMSSSDPTPLNKRISSRKFRRIVLGVHRKT